MDQAGKYPETMLGEHDILTGFIALMCQDAESAADGDMFDDANILMQIVYIMTNADYMRIAEDDAKFEHTESEAQKAVNKKHKVRVELFKVKDNPRHPYKIQMTKYENKAKEKYPVVEIDYERLKVESNLEMYRGPESLREELQKEVITIDARSCLRALDKIRSQAAVSSGEEAEDAVAIGGAMSQATNASSVYLSAPSVSSPLKRKQKTN